MNKFLLVFIIFFSFSSQGKQKPILLSPKEKSNKKVLDVYKKNKGKKFYHDRMVVDKDFRGQFPDIACSNKSPIRKCFNVSKKECMKRAALTLDLCIHNAKAKRKISSLEKHSYSKKIGKCIGEKLNASLKSKKRKCK